MIVKRDSENLPLELESPSSSSGTGNRIGPRCWRTSSFKIYLCHIFSSWGDRMWGFAVELYMVILFPDSLLLTAIYGFTNCLSGIIFGPYIGGWIDKSQRITAARCSVVVQNLAVVLGATVLALTLHFRSDVKSVWDGKLEYMLFGLTILIAIVAELASVANKIALEKDWIVVLAGGDNKQLSRLNATMRTINLTTSILAPIVVGQIIHFGSQVSGAVFIAVWNIISGIIEYHLLIQIFKIVPELSTKNGANDDIPFVKISSLESSSSPTSPSETNNNTRNHQNHTPDSHTNPNNNQNDKVPNIQLQIASPTSTNAITPIPQTTTSLLVNQDGPKLCLTPGPDFEYISLITPISTNKTHLPQAHTTNKGDSHQPSLTSTPFSDVSGSCQTNPGRDKEKVTGLRARVRKACVACQGWRLYFSHNAKFAGLGLAFLYMTVLGFDSITTGFVYSQGVNESFIGILTAIGALFGIMGSLSFPILRRKLGKNRTGILGFSSETVVLLFCVGSVFVSGSPFNPGALLDRFKNVSGTSFSSYYIRPTSSLKEIWERETHVIFLLVGIITARYGLWIADLSVTQIFQEEVEESQRGVINGVQDSLNKVMDLAKFGLVILLPSTETFGYLIITSWLFVFLGMVSFILFTREDRRRTKSQIPSTQVQRISTISGGV